MSEREHSRFPYEDGFEIDRHLLRASRVVELLEDQISDRRRERIDQVIGNRTFSAVTVLDGIYDRGNVSAVMRSAEALGFSEMHVIESQEGFKAANRVTQGADKWLEVHKYDSPTPCLETLKSRGYRIVATHLEASVPLDEIDFSEPTAIVFGNERDGVCQEVLDASDARVIIPMLGFAQSFNISVAAAISLYHIVSDRRRRLGRHGDLDEKEQMILRAMYYLRSVGQAEAILRRRI
jgi:tRNA (guanosine-2'-O-)-methyltransferase